MKTNKKYVIMMLLLTFIIVSIILYFMLNKERELVCVNKINDNKITYKIVFKKNIKNLNIKYDLNYKTMDEVVDNYDNVKAYLDIIKKNEGVITNIEQEEKKLTYYMNYDMKKINQKDYDLYGIKDIVKLNNEKDIIKYFNDKKYECK